MKMYKLSMLKLVSLVGAFAFVGLGCNTSLTMNASALVVDPDSAWAGDNVQFNFSLTVIPARTVQLTALVDDQPYQTRTETLNVNGPFEWLLGDAEDLLNRFGAGPHMGRVRVLDLESGREVDTIPDEFVLVDGAP